MMKILLCCLMLLLPVTMFAQRVDASPCSKTVHFYWFGQTYENECDWGNGGYYEYCEWDYIFPSRNYCISYRW